MATPQATAMGFNDYQTALALVNTNLAGEDYPAANRALAKAMVILAGLPNEIVTGQQTTKMIEMGSLQKIQQAIALSQAGAATSFGLLEIVRAR